MSCFRIFLSFIVLMCLVQGFQEARAQDFPLTSEEIEAHVRFLSDDLLEGRAIGTRGLEIAALYQESFFRGIGLEPLFPGSYRQRLLLRGSTPDKNGRLQLSGTAGAWTLKINEDFVINSFREDCPASVEGNVVYCGYCVQAPEKKWDDIKGCDLRGKILLVEINEPGNRPGGIFEGEDMTYYGRWSCKFEKAQQLGAAGILIIHHRKRAAYDWDVVLNSWSCENFFPCDVPQKLFFQGWITEKAADDMLRRAGLDHGNLLARAELPGFRPVDTGLKCTVCQTSSFRTVSTENVAGLLRGTHREHTNRYIILSAHYDHLGISDGGSGDRIYNGAVDNCSASATMLALARYFSQRPQELRVNLIFLAATAEEGGIFGSDYFMRHLPVKKSEVLADLNFEMTSVWGETEDLYAIGAKHSDLDEICRKAALQMGTAYVPEQGGEQGLFFRSDQMSFARGGIPAVWLHQGTVSRGPDRGLIGRKTRMYVDSRYHRVSDEMEADWDLRGALQIARWAQGIIAALNDRSDLPQFKKSSSFSR